MEKLGEENEIALKHLSKKFKTSIFVKDDSHHNNNNIKNMMNLKNNTVQLKIKSPANTQIIRSATIEKFDISPIEEQEINLKNCKNFNTPLNNIKHESKIINESVYFLPCFDPELDQIYFIDFLTENIIVEKTDTFIKSEEEELYKSLVLKLNENFKTIKSLSKLEDKDFLSNHSLKYFRRPLLSQLMKPERLELNNFNSTYPLPSEFLKYGKVSLRIKIHHSVYGNEKVSLPKEMRMFERDVGFYYV
jgi:hypothetical protein